MKATVIYHSADFDGIFCREIAKKFLPDSNLIGWNFGDKPLEIPNGPIYVLDLPLDEPFGFKYKAGDDKGPQHPNGLVWIDHHKSSIESHPKDITGYRIDGVAACRLAWQWFNHGRALGFPPPSKYLPTKQQFIDREVLEPLAVRLAGEYDIWDKRDPNAEVFQFALCSTELNSYHWDNLLSLGLEETVDGSKITHSEAMVSALLKDGFLLQRYQQSSDKGMMFRSFMVEFEGLKFLALTTARCNSLTFASKDIPESGHDALMGFYFNGKTWTVSLYHAKHNTGIDLSQVAVKYGGGGHRGACGFTIEKLPFLK